jgi:site-specific DNA-methyltransferase (adenine-specific)
VLELFPTQGEKSEARFFYCSKASKHERNAGLEGMEEKQTVGGGGLTAGKRGDGSYETASAGGKYGSIKAKQQNHHPTVKPVKLMEYLVRLVTPKNGVCLDPFMGSGTTALACKQLRRRYIGFEIDSNYVEIAQKRLSQKVLFPLAEQQEGGAIPPKDKSLGILANFL